ncbi:MAG: chorismate synthase [Candidatus Omnitrophica bacterium]|nr:chorismate synthase [Candidatus Omnitrophota bacterium]
MLRFMSAGESHGECMVAIIEGLPAGLYIDENIINQDLFRRQQGYGRGGRMQIERDTVKILTGLKAKKTLGSPITLMIKNKDFKINELPAITQPRPGHADLSGAIKYGFSDMRCVLERASARETVVRVAAGAIAKIFLSEFGIKISSKVISVGGQTNSKKIKEKIDFARNKKDTLGGIFEVAVMNVPAGLGSYVHYDRRLDARLALALMSIPAIKAVEFGMGFEAANKLGSQVHDQISYSLKKGFFRLTNNAGGLEGGMSNAQTIIARCGMKPIATLGNPLKTIDFKTKKPVKASVQRSDISAVEAAGVIGESMSALVIADAFMERFGSDDLRRIKKAFKLK